MGALTMHSTFMMDTKDGRRKKEGALKGKAIH